MADDVAPGNFVHVTNVGEFPGGGAASSDVNIEEVNGAAIAQGHGTAATAIRVELPTDGTGTVIVTGTGGNAITATSPTDGIGTGNVTQVTQAYNRVFNGTGWDRQRGSLSDGTLVKPYAFAASDWSYAAAAVGINNTTTAVTFKAAAGASVRNYLTSIQISSDALGAATEIAVRDGAGGTVLWRMKIGTTGWPNGVSFTFPNPLRSTANTLLEVVTLTASITGSIYFNAQGYTGA